MHLIQESRFAIDILVHEENQVELENAHIKSMLSSGSNFSLIVSFVKENKQHPSRSCPLTQSVDCVISYHAI